MLTPAEWDALELSARVAVCAVLCSAPFGIAIAYLLARGRFPGKALVETVVNLPLVLPPIVTGFFLLVLFGRNGPIGSLLENYAGLQVAFTWIGAALAAAVVGFPLMVRAIRLAFEGIDPRLEIAARSLGATKLRAFFTISLPLAARGIAAGSVLAFGRALGEFGATIMIAGNIPGQTQTIPLAVFSNAQRPGGIEESWRLVALAVVLAATALFASEWLERRGRRDESA